MKQQKTKKPSARDRRRAGEAQPAYRFIWQRAEALRRRPAPPALVMTQLQAAFDALLPLVPNLHAPPVGEREQARLLGGLFPQAGGLVARLATSLCRQPARYPEFPGRGADLLERQTLVEQLQLFAAVSGAMATSARAMANVLQAQALHESLEIIDEVNQRAALARKDDPRPAVRDLHAARVDDVEAAAQLLRAARRERAARWRRSRARTVASDAPRRRPRADGSDARELLAQLVAGLAKT